MYYGGGSEGYIHYNIGGNKGSIYGIMVEAVRYIYYNIVEGLRDVFTVLAWSD